MDTIEMPKTYRELLDELEIGKSILITDDNKSVWSTNVSRIHKDTKKQFTIRTNRENGEVRVWRLADTTEAK